MKVDVPGETNFLVASRNVSNVWTTQCPVSKHSLSFEVDILSNSFRRT